MTLDAFDDYLRDRGLLPRTRRAYCGVIGRAVDGDVGAYVRRLVRQRSPEGTVVQARAAAVHWLVFSGASDIEIASLPRAKGRKGRIRDALSPAALDRFLELAATRREPVRTILLLLPRTGLRISEICNLRTKAVKERDGRMYLDFRGKGDKHRLVPLGTAGTALLTAALGRLKSPKADTPLFSAKGGRPIAPSTVRDVIVLLREREDDLQGVTPHVLRHTYATRALAGGIDLPRLQAILGHESITTTQRYLHPSVDDLADAVDKLEGL